jgi:very-short-patch-repair endonuclease
MEKKHICKICGKEFATYQKLGGHMSSHFRARKPKKEKHECRYCSKEFKEGYQLGSHVRMCKLNPKYHERLEQVKEKMQDYKHSDETKKILSEKLKKAHTEGRAWNIGMSRWNNEPSYPEKFFMQVIKNEFKDKNYESEYPFGKFSIDFAWPHLKKAIEIDGEQHYRDKNQMRIDKEKNELLKQEGWQLLRIRWKLMFKDTKSYIKKAKRFIES